MNIEKQLLCKNMFFLFPAKMEENGLFKKPSEQQIKHSKCN